MFSDNQVLEVSWCHALHTFEDLQEDFKINPFTHRQPVEFFQGWGDMIEFFDSANNSRSVILNPLKWRKRLHRKAS